MINPRFDDSNRAVDFSSALLLVAVEWLENGDLLRV